jgi:hypothetical protein
MTGIRQDSRPCSFGSAGEQQRTLSLRCQELSPTGSKYRRGGAFGSVAVLVETKAVLERVQSPSAGVELVLNEEKIAFGVDAPKVAWPATAHDP